MNLAQQRRQPPPEVLRHPADAHAQSLNYCRRRETAEIRCFAGMQSRRPRQMDAINDNRIIHCVLT